MLNMPLKQITDYTEAMSRKDSNESKTTYTTVYNIQNRTYEHTRHEKFLYNIVRVSFPLY